MGVLVLCCFLIFLFLVWVGVRVTAPRCSVVGASLTVGGGPWCALGVAVPGLVVGWLAFVDWSACCFGGWRVGFGGGFAGGHRLDRFLWCGF